MAKITFHFRKCYENCHLIYKNLFLLWYINKITKLQLLGSPVVINKFHATTSQNHLQILTMIYFFSLASQYGRKKGNSFSTPVSHKQRSQSHKESRNGVSIIKAMFTLRQDNTDNTVNLCLCIAINVAYFKASM